MEITKEQILQGIEYALIHLYDKDKYLLEHKVHEQAIVFRFALYFENFVNSLGKDYNLDVEYNKNMDNPKRIRANENGKKPDLIIHSRGSNECNLLILEFKTYWNSNYQQDFKKLKEFCRANEYNYQYGACIILGREKADTHIEWVC